jgi:hypothetical protein
MPHAQQAKKKNTTQREKRERSPAWKDTKAMMAVTILVMAVAKPNIAITVRPVLVSAISLPASANFLNMLGGASSSSSLFFSFELDIFEDE